MRVLGAILCGGGATRFGSDKAFALLDGTSLIERVRDALTPQVDALVSCGRPVLDLEGLGDRPGPGLGPLGGLNAALHAAATGGFDAVLSVPCDVPFLPADLRRQLGEPGPAYAAQLPVIGLWPSALAATLDAHVRRDSRRSMRGWAERVDARCVRLATEVVNINAPADLIALRRSDD